MYIMNKLYKEITAFKAKRLPTMQVFGTSPYETLFDWEHSAQMFWRNNHSKVRLSKYLPDLRAYSELVHVMYRCFAL